MKYFQKKTGGKHEMKKKIVSMLLVAAMVASMAVGCGSKNDSGNSDTKSDKGESITFMAPDWAIPSDDQLDEFTKETGIEVEVSEVGWDDIREKLATAETGNKNVEINVFIANVFPKKQRPIKNKAILIIATHKETEIPV